MCHLDNSIIPVDAVFGKAVFFHQLFLKIKEFLFTDNLPVQHNPGNSHAGDLADYPIAKVTLAGDEHFKVTGSRFSY